jgi:hypothetical protein
MEFASGNTYSLLAPDGLVALTTTCRPASSAVYNTSSHDTHTTIENGRTVEPRCIA